MNSTAHEVKSTVDEETLKCLEDCKSKSEDVQAEFGLLKTMLGVIDGYVFHNIENAPLPEGYKWLMKQYTGELQNLVSIQLHLVYEMEKAQDELVHILATKVFEENRKRREGIV